MLHEEKKKAFVKGNGVHALIFLKVVLDQNDVIARFPAVISLTRMSFATWLFPLPGRPLIMMTIY